MAKTDKAQKIKSDIEKKKQAFVTLQSLNGKKLTELTKTEREAYDNAIGVLLNILGTDLRINV